MAVVTVVLGVMEALDTEEGKFWNNPYTFIIKILKTFSLGSAAATVVLGVMGALDTEEGKIWKIPYKYYHNT